LTNPPQPAPHLIAFTNGVLDFHALLGGQPVRLTPHAPALFSLSCLPFAYDSGATCPTFDQFLNQMFPDPDVRALLQEWTGYNIVYDVSQQRFLILYGEGANGKTVYTTCLRELLGGRNVTGLGLEAFNSGRTFPLAATLGKLANISGEIGEWDKTAEGLLKQYVSGERMTVERKHRDPFEFTPSARLTFCTNTLPRFVDRSDGLWRRLLLVPCTVQILDEKLQDKRLVSPEFWRTSGELPGVLNWAIEGLRRLRQRGHFQEPAACKAAKTEFRVESNPAAVFLAENVRANPTGSIVSSDLYGRYKGWAEAAGHHPLPAPHFGREVGRAFPGATLSTHARLHAMGSTRSRTWTGITFQ
jgi:P4 family phage/plasmid primase-like protien